jgi:hypothetical protein
MLDSQGLSSMELVITNKNIDKLHEEVNILNVSMYHGLEASPGREHGCCG